MLRRPNYESCIFSPLYRYDGGGSFGSLYGVVIVHGFFSTRLHSLACALIRIKI